MTSQPTTIVVDGQGHRVASSGGVAQYGRQLLRGLRTALARRPEIRQVLDINLCEDARRGGLWRTLVDALDRTPLGRRLRPQGFLPLPCPVPAPAGGERLLCHEISNHVVNQSLARYRSSPRLCLCVTVIDLQEELFPQFFSDFQLYLRRCANLFYKDRADVLFAISQFSKDTFCERFSVAPERVIVTPLAADDCAYDESAKAPPPWVQAFRRYLVYPAKPWPHKNHQRLIRAFAKQRESVRRHDLSLVLTGGFNGQDVARLRKCAADEGIPDRVHVLGFLPRPLLDQVLRHAEAMIFPSLFEGFGLPILEAMQLGCPVAASRATALPEVVGDAGLLFDPEDVEAMATVIGQFATGDVDRDLLIRRGRENARRFSWETTIQLTLDGYRLVR